MIKEIKMITLMSALFMQKTTARAERIQQGQKRYMARIKYVVHVQFVLVATPPLIKINFYFVYYRA
jgi:hypothetical protein